MKKSFGFRELCKCLRCLGFTFKSQEGSHVKYYVPKRTKIPTGVRPFIIVIMGRKTYDPNTRKSYFTQIKRLGFTRQQIDECMP